MNRKKGILKWTEI